MELREAKPMSRLQIRDFARTLRKKSGIKGLYFPIVEFLEEIMPLIDDDYDFEVTDDINEDCEAITFPDAHIIKVRTSIYEKAVNGDERSRFTLCHELFHYIFHGNEDISFARSDTNVPTYRNPEWQANTFAAELLVPKDLVKGMDIYEIHDECGVSMQCAYIQMQKYALN